MYRLSLFTLVLLIGLSVIIAKSDGRFRHLNQKRSFRNNDQQRHLRHLMGRLIDSETNTVYAVQGEKQADPSIITEAAVAPSSPLSTSISAESAPNRDEFACLAACHSCVEDYPIINVSFGDTVTSCSSDQPFFPSQRKRAADNCGPMCDCADSCFRLPIEQVE